MSNSFNQLLDGEITLDEYWKLNSTWKITDVVPGKRLVHIVLTSSYIYYLHPDKTPLMNDSLFDEAMRVLRKNFDTIEHKHKHLITEDDLACGSLFGLKEEDYPEEVKYVANAMSDAN